MGQRLDQPSRTLVPFVDGREARYIKKIKRMSKDDRSGDVARLRFFSADYCAAAGG